VGCRAAPHRAATVELSLFGHGQQHACKLSVHDCTACCVGCESLPLGCSIELLVLVCSTTHGVRIGREVLRLPCFAKRAVIAPWNGRHAREPIRATQRWRARRLRGVSLALAESLNAIGIGELCGVVHSRFPWSWSVRAHLLSVSRALRCGSTRDRASIAQDHSTGRTDVNGRARQPRAPQRTDPASHAKKPP
jgi:hypothetical protein